MSIAWVGCKTARPLHQAKGKKADARLAVTMQLIVHEKHERNEKSEIVRIGTRRKIDH
jgi:hypothetical protein